MLQCRAEQVLRYQTRTIIRLNTDFMTVNLLLMRHFIELKLHRTLELTCKSSPEWRRDSVEPYLFQKKNMINMFSNV